MKNLEMLSEKETREISGGSWLSRAFDNVVDALESARDWVEDMTGIALGNTTRN